MKTTLRILVLLGVLAGIVGLATDQAAWAAYSPEKFSPSVSQGDESLVSAGDDFCDRPWNRFSERCRNKDNRCKNHPEKCGSVKPPSRQVFIPVTGEYSVGGFCTVNIVLNDPAIWLDTQIQTPLPVTLPGKVQKVRQGCLLTYYNSKQRIDELPADSGNATICFAATPGKQMIVYFYSTYSSKPEWVSRETTVESGKACASANASGLYIATFQRQ